MTGTIGILNVGCGDTKLVFDPTNPQECIRAARIVKDMLRRGYALLVQVPPKKEGDKPTYQRIQDFREDTHEYIIADLDPEIAAAADAQEEQGAPNSKRKSKTRRLKASNTRAVAVPHRAGG